MPRATGNDVRILELFPEDKGPDGALIRHFDSIAQCLAAVTRATTGEVLTVKAPPPSQLASSGSRQVETPLVKIGSDGHAPPSFGATPMAEPPQIIRPYQYRLSLPLRSV